MAQLPRPAYFLAILAGLFLPLACGGDAAGVVPEELRIELRPSPASSFGASDGSIDLTITGGTPPFDISWSNGASAEDINGLSAGIYSVTVTDSGGQIASGSVEVTQPNEVGSVMDFEGNSYPTVRIGNQWWMAASLDVERDPNGNSVTGYCYGHEAQNCDIYGRLYTWQTAMNGSTSEGAQGLCPRGWHIPSSGDWTALFNHLGGAEIAGGKMKATGTTLWLPPNEGATDSSGFHALPAGGYMVEMNLFEGLGVGVHFWSSTEYGMNALIPTLHKDEAGVTLLIESKRVTASMRCVQG